MNPVISIQLVSSTYSLRMFFIKFYRDLHFRYQLFTSGYRISTIIEYIGLLTSEIENDTSDYLITYY